MENNKKVILDLCGGTGSWSRDYKEAGYDVKVITLPKYNILATKLTDEDIVFRKDLNDNYRIIVKKEDVYGILAAPPCTEFSYAKHFHGKGNYSHDFEAGLKIVRGCFNVIWSTRPKWWCLENPRGYLKRWLGKPAETFEPWQYGDNYQKRTDLWGNFKMPRPAVLKKPEGLVKFSMLKSKEIYPEYYGKLTRQERRAITPPGFTKAFFKENR